MKAGHQPIIRRVLGNHDQIDLIDMQSMPDGPFKFLCTYEDHGIKIQWLVPLTQKTCRAVSWVLYQLFSFIGAPKTLQLDNGREFNKAALGGKGHQMLLDEAVSSTFSICNLNKHHVLIIDCTFLLSLSMEL